MRWNKITLVGVGLLGGTLGMAIKRRRLARCLEGYVRRAANVGECKSLGAVDRATLDLQSAVAGADLVVLCTPLAQLRPLVKHIQVHLGAGSYVCGEASALVESLEGKRGIPRNRPPRLAEKGYLGLPTIVNNVESYLRSRLDRAARCGLVPRARNQPLVGDQAALGVR